MDNGLFEELFPFWVDLTNNQKDRIAENITHNVYEPGQRVHGGYEDCTGVIIVKEGRLRVYLLSEDGKEVTLFRLIENDACLLSASCIIKNISFDVYVDTENTTELYILNAAVYDKIAKENPKVANCMTELLSMRFSEAMWVMEQILFMKLDKRLALFLLNQASLEGGDDINLTHQQIAGHIGSAREVVTRMLKYFANEGVISVNRKGIKILDRKKMAAFAD